MDILEFVNKTRDLGRAPALVTNIVALAASLVRLHRRTRNRTIRAEYAAIARERLQSLTTALAIVEELAGVGGHRLQRLMAAFRASKR